MGEYLFKCVILLNMILLSNTGPIESRRDFQTRDDEFNKCNNLKRRGVSAIAAGKSKKYDILLPDVTTGVTVSTDGRAAFTPARKGTNCMEDICSTDDKDYPYEHIHKILDKLKVYDKLFGFAEGATVNTNTEFQGKHSDALCASITRTLFPKILKNVNNTERYIINTEGNKQGLTFESCINKAKCRFASLFPKDYVSECTQKFTRTRLLALGDDGNPSFDTFLVPSCCVCTIKQVETK